jgi:hypothetical protein
MEDLADYHAEVSGDGPDRLVMIPIGYSAGS